MSDEARVYDLDLLVAAEPDTPTPRLFDLDALVASEITTDPFPRLMDLNVLVAMSDHPAPVADFSFVVNETTVNFTDLSTVGDGSALAEWEWTAERLNDGPALVSTAQNPSVFFYEPGDWEVTLKVTNAIGSFASVTKTVTPTALSNPGGFSAGFDDGFEHAGAPGGGGGPSTGESIISTYIVRGG